MIRIDIEMPKTCYECPFAMHSYATLYGKGTKRIQGNYSCVLTHKAITTTKRNRFCPLKELVQCKDCELFETGVDMGCGWCNNWDNKTGENGFCSQGR